jgi:hypothetical protein
VALERPNSGESQEKRIYSLTEAGEAELRGWFAGSVGSEHQRDEFFIKLMIALTLQNGAANPYKVIQIQRARLYQDLHQLTSRRSQGDPHTGLAQILLADKAIMHLEADLRWLDMIEARLDDIREQPAPEPEIRPRGRPRKAGKSQE